MSANEMLEFAKQLWPIPRSLTGDGVRQTLFHIQKHLPELKMHEVRSGTDCFDWKIPKEWKVKSAVLKAPDGEIVADFSVNNLHLVGYSIPFTGRMDFEELQKHLFSLPAQPTAIPYITSYYKDFWGFCISDEKRKTLKPGTYEVKIDTELFDGNLTYGEVVIPGQRKEEIFVSTYVCHPSMANNELSGPVVSTFLAKSLLGKKNRYTYRFVFIPETIGSIVYLSRNLEQMKKNIKAGLNLSCIGDEREYSIMPTRLGNTYADKVVARALEKMDGKKVVYSFFDRGSDERQYCSPGADLPVASLFRSKYAEYPEYHTSLDNFDLVTAKGLEGGLKFAQTAVDIFENDVIYKNIVPCEPQLGKRGLYPTISTVGSAASVRNMMNILAYCDGNHSIEDLAKLLSIQAAEVKEIVENLHQNGLLIVV